MNGSSTILISAFCAIISGTAVAFLSPRFAHLVWKKQKRREQQIAVAEKFERLFSDIHISGNIRPKPTGEKATDERLLIIESRFWEQQALFILTWVLFEREDTLALATQLMRMVNEGSRDFQNLYRVRTEFLGRVNTI